ALLVVFMLNCFCNFSQAQNFVEDCEKKAHEQYLFDHENTTDEQRAKYFENLGECYSSTNQYKKALEAFTKSAHIYKNLNLTDFYWGVVKNIGYTHYQMGEYNKALKYYFDVLKYFETRQNWRNVAYTYNNIGILFHRQHDTEKALFYYDKVEKILKKYPEVKGEIYPMLYTNIGLSYYALAAYEKAKENYLKALKFNEKTGDKHIHNVIIGNMASAYQRLKDYEKAEIYFKEAIEKSHEQGNEMSEIINNADLGSIYLNMAKEEYSVTKRNTLLNKAIQCFQKALQFFKDTKDLRRYSGYSGELSNAYELKGDYQKALEIYKEHISYEKSIFN